MKEAPVFGGDERAYDAEVHRDEVWRFLGSLVDVYMLLGVGPVGWMGDQPFYNVHCRHLVVEVNNVYEEVRLSQDEPAGVEDYGDRELVFSFISVPGNDGSNGGFGMGI